MQWRKIASLWRFELLKRIDRPLLIDSLNGALGFLKTCTEKDKQLQYKLLVYEKVVFV